MRFRQATAGRRESETTDSSTISFLRLVPIPLKDEVARCGTDSVD